MKNYSRAYNRYMKHVKFKKRIKNWFAVNWNHDANEIEKAISGEGYTFLRTTSRPCNCYGCTYRKYEREHKHKVIDSAMKDLRP